jgi:uncharacterized protein
MLIRFIIFLILIYLLYRIIKSFFPATPDKMNNRQFKSTSIAGEDLVEDPVCHTYIPESQAYKKEIAGKIYFFCSEECYESYISEKRNERR